MKQQSSPQQERPTENGASSITATNSTSPATKLPTFNLANGSNLTGDDNQLISRRHSSEILVSLGNESHNHNRSNEASNG